MVQLSALDPAAQIHDPSVGRHVSGSLHLERQLREQLVPKYPSSQARG